MEQNTLYYQMMQMLEGLQRPEGALYLALAIVAVSFTVGMRSTRWILLALLCYVSSFGLSTFTGLNLATPLQQIRAYGRGICAFLLFLMVIPAIQSHRGWRRHIFPMGLVFYYICQMIVSARTLYSGDFVRGYFSLLSYTLIFIALAFGLSRWLQTAKDAEAVIKSIVGAGLMFCLGCMYQYVINRNQIVWSGRFMGTTANANHAGALLGVIVPAAIYVFIRARSRQTPGEIGEASNPWIIRLVSIGVASLAGVMLVWTGSRSGALIGVFGTLLLLRFRLGRFALLALVSGVLVLAILSMLEDAKIGDIAGRLLDTTNTRSGPWKNLWNTFLDSPLVGKSAQEAAGGSENSYLLIASRIGLLGLVPFMTGVTLTLVNLIRLQRMRRYLGDQVLLADLCTGGILAILLGGVFEGYLFATFSIPLFAFYIYACIAQYLLDYSHAMHQQQYLQSMQPEDEQGYYEDEYEPQYAASEYDQPVHHHGQNV